MGNVAVDTPSQIGFPTDVPMTPDAAEKLFEAMNLSGMGAAAPDRHVKTAILSLTGAAIHAGTGGVIAWTNPESTAILILRAILDITTVAGGASTLDVGVTETSATTTSDTLLDGIDAAALGVSDSMNAALDAGANAKAQKLAAAKWVTVDEKTGDVTGLVGKLYIQYILI